MMARVPDISSRRHLLQHIQRHASLLQSRQLDVASGTRIHRPSDGLFETSRAMAAMSEQRAAEGYRRATESTEFLAATLENGITSALDLVTKARGVAVRAASDSNDVALDALAEEIDATLEELLEVANRRSLGGHVFAGRASGTVPYVATRDVNGDITAVTAAPGIDVPIVRFVGRSEVDVPVTGTTLFEGGGDTFAELIALRDAILADDEVAIQAGMSALEGIESHMSNELASIGTLRNRIDSAVARLTDEEIELEEERSRSMDTDMAEAMVQLSSEEFFYQAALSVSARVSNLSILNFL